MNHIWQCVVMCKTKILPNNLGSSTKSSTTTISDASSLSNLSMLARSYTYDHASVLLAVRFLLSVFKGFLLALTWYAMIKTYLSNYPSRHYCYIRQTSARHNRPSICVQTYVSKQRSTLSDMSKSMHSCSRAMSCISRSSPCPICSHSSNVSGSTSAMMPNDPIHPTPGHSPNWGRIRR